MLSALHPPGDLAGADVAVVDLIPVVNEPRHFTHAGIGP